LLRRLRRRHAARYCGRDCQEAAWAAHKKTCTYTSLCHFAVLRTCAGELDGAVTLLKKATKAARALLGADSLPAAFLELKQAELLFHPQQPGSGAARVPLWLAGAELWRAALPTLERRRAAGTLLPGAVAPAESVFLERQRLSMLEGGAWTADASRLILYRWRSRRPNGTDSRSSRKHRRAGARHRPCLLRQRGLYRAHLSQPSLLWRAVSGAERCGPGRGAGVRAYGAVADRGVARL
jgi:hypothetical protein